MFSYNYAARRLWNANVLLVKNLPALMLSLAFCAGLAEAKEWRSIIPLRSTRGDVERLFGKPNQLGHYQIQNEKVSIWYSEGACKSSPESLAKANCECLVAKDTVLRIAVTLDSPIKISELGIDKKKYERTPIEAYQPSATYADFVEGVVYTIRESDDKVTFIDYLPSARDCDRVIGNQTIAASNGWRGIVPLRSTRGEVERMLGPHKTSVGEIYVYDIADRRVDISYASDPCAFNGRNPPRSTDVVIKIIVSPRRSVLVRDLGLDRKYSRIQSDHPENWVQYVNSTDGITIEAIRRDECEEVVSIIYEPSEKDRDARCGPRAQNNARSFRTANFAHANLSKYRTTVQKRRRKVYELARKHFLIALTLVPNRG